MHLRPPSRLRIFGIFFRLGCIAFGGPVAHLGYFRDAFVRRDVWLMEAEYADLVALCQFLPGPASSQVAFAIGYRQAGFGGAFVAWLGFTLPSAILMITFATGLATAANLTETNWSGGLKLAAAVVANALWNMAARLCPDVRRASLAAGTAAALPLLPGTLWQIAAIAASAAFGRFFLPETEHEAPSTGSSTGNRSGWRWLAAFASCLVLLPIAALIFPDTPVAVADAFYRAGALVFGGGHVVLPLLDGFTVGNDWIDRDTFLAGYGAAQALPGPLFSFAAFLGASLVPGPGGIAGGLLALGAIYLPSWLLVPGVLPFWERLRGHRNARAALAGTNAAVVGLLLAALYDPLWIHTVTGPTHLALAMGAFGLLRFGRVPPWAVVILCALAGAVWHL